MTTKPVRSNRLLIILGSAIGVLLLIVVGQAAGPNGERVSETWTVTDLSR